MKRVVLLMALAAFVASCGIKIDNPEKLTSPDGKLELRVGLAQGGVPAYELFRDGKAVVKPSRLGFKLIDKDNLDKGFSLVDATRDSFDETWEPVWGEESSIRNHYNELLVRLTRKDGVNMNLRFRLYDEGLGFRYEFPVENKLTYFNIDEELTEFALTGNHTAWW
ncbi:MAG: glycoside hydrolase family 97 N-terminal domain-containing protein, partial [Bacteroidales bacterium]|nr:glycoside hydrolase family 97 N-terminal domain-containing protein [Bacteroidales bacterium]